MSGWIRQCMALAAMGLAIATGAGAQSNNTVIVHNGQTNPMTEGWFGGPNGTFDYTNPGFQGGIGPQQVGGVDVWRVLDVVNPPSYLSNATTYEYSVAPYSGTGATQTNAQDWLISAYVNPLAAGSSNPNCPACTLYNAMITVRSHVMTPSSGVPFGFNYSVAFEKLADGTNRVHWEMTSANVFAHSAVVSGGFIWVELLRRVSTGRVGLYVNGTLLDPDVGGLYTFYNDNRISWGDHQYAYADFGGADWAQVRWERGPDPITLQGAGCGFTSYCPATANSFSTGGASLTAYGSTSVAANNLSLQATGIPPGRSAALFMGPQQASLPFGNGTLCVGGGIVRLPILISNAQGGAQQYLNQSSSQLSGLLTAGSTWNMQFVYRDPSMGPAGYNASNALQVHFCP